jgi:hypothetical protein
MRTAKEKGIKLPEFQSQKQRLLTLHYLLEHTEGLSASQIQSLADAVFGSQDRRKILTLLKDKGKTATSFFSSMFQRTNLTKEETLWREAYNFATTQVSDSRFLSDFMNPLNSCLYRATAEAEETAYAWLAKQIGPLESLIQRQILTIQKEECNKQAQREVKSEEDRELRRLRSDFVRQIEDLSRERSKSYVFISLAWCR